MIAAGFALYLTAYTLGADIFSAYGGNNPHAVGVQTRIVEFFPSMPGDLAECEKYANERRKQKAKDFDLPDYRLLKFVCRQLEPAK